MASIHYIQSNDDDVQLDIYSARSLKQQSAGRHIASFGHIMIILSQPVFALSFPLMMCMEKYKFTNCVIVGGLSPRAATLGTSTQTIRRLSVKLRFMLSICITIIQTYFRIICKLFIRTVSLLDTKLRRKTIGCFRRT